MASEKLTVFVVVDADGNYEVGPDADTARARYEENVGTLGECDGFRFVEMTVSVPLPKPIEVSVDVPEGEEEATVTVK